MADISTELARILSAIYGEDVRGSIHDAIEKINDVSEVVLTTGTAVTGPSSSSTGFYDDSLYLNTDTFELWKCTGVNTWASQGILKGEAGDDGNGIVSIVKTATSGLVDTYTITYSDGTTSTFDVTNGADGTDGNDGNDGVSVTGVSLISKVGLLATYRMSFSNGTYFDYTVSDGASGSGTGDMTKAVYDTDNDGIVDAAKTLSGLTATIADLNKTANLATVATSGSYNDLTNKPTAGTGIAINNNVIAVDADNTPTAGSEKPVKSKGVYSALESNRAESASLLKSTVGWTGKNKLNITLAELKSINTSGSWSGSTYAYRGITYTFTTNSEDSITKIEASGSVTDSSDISFLFLCDKLNISESLIINGCPSGGGQFVYKLLATNKTGGSLNLPEDYGSGANIGIITSDFRIQLRIYGGAGTVNNLTFYPMLRDASITDDTYEPYHESVEEEIEQIYADNGVLGAKNLLKYPYITTTITKNGITFTDNGDGSVTVNGTATASADFHCGVSSTPYYHDFVNRYKGTDRKFRFAGKTSNVRLQFWSTNFTVYNEDVFAFPANINMNNFNFSIHVNNGVTVNNETIYPMMILASDPDDTYVPYAMTNRELTEELTAINNGLDDWTSPAQVSSSGTVSFSGLNDSYSYSRPYYELPSGESAYTYSKVSKSGSGTSVTLTYTTDAPIGTVCKLRILK